MSKVKLLLDVVTDMRSLADSLMAVADALEGNESTEAPEPAAPAKEAKKITLEDVRAKLAEKSQAGFTAEVREIIQKYGGSKLSEVSPEHYAEILESAEGLGNG